MKQHRPTTILFLCLSLFFVSNIIAQTAITVPAKVKIAVLCPLYLDSAFTDYTYNLGSSNMPQYILTGLDFYNGVMLAVDSLNKEHINAEVWIYDTRKKNTDVNAMLQGMKALNFSLIVASLTTGTEQKAISDFSFANNIPVVSVTYPNDAGVTANPYFIMLNPTLKTHISGIYQYVQQNFIYNKPVFITKYGALENKIASDFKANDSLIKNHFNYKVLELNNDVDISYLQPYLDSTKQNTVICGSMNLDFASSLVKVLGNNPQYKTTLIGMPNWDGIRKLFNNSYDNIDIVYSTPFNYNDSAVSVKNLTLKYKAKYFARPSDLVYKGFEAMYHYTHIVTDYPTDFLSHVSDAAYQWQNLFSVQPVMLTDQSQVPDYLENKNLYFIKKNGQSVVSVTQVKK